MKKLFITLFCLLSPLLFLAQENEKLIELGKAYKNFMFRNDPPKEVISDLKKECPENLNATTNFIIQTISKDNDLLKTEYLKVPNEPSLKFLYIVRAINYNIRKENQKDNNKLIDSLKIAPIPHNELLDSYYDLLFTAVGNKNQPFNFSKTNFKLKEYNLSNDTEKGIFFLKCMNLCGTNIWGYMNVPKPPNTEKALELIKKYPKFDSLPYYQYTDLNFPDFELVIDSEKGKESYKGYYINKYYETLIYNIICLKKENGKQKEIDDILLGSILKDHSLYKYTKYKETLEETFKLQKTD
jgi:hypothetical protein